MSLILWVISKSFLIRWTTTNQIFQDMKSWGGCHFFTLAYWMPSLREFESWAKYKNYKSLELSLEALFETFHEFLPMRSLLAYVLLKTWQFSFSFTSLNYSLHTSKKIFFSFASISLIWILFLATSNHKSPRSHEAFPLRYKSRHMEATICLTGFQDPGADN